MEKFTGKLKLEGSDKKIEVDVYASDDPGTWLYDCFGSNLSKDCAFIYLTPNKDGSDLVMHIGVCVGRDRDGILYFAKLKSPKYKNSYDSYIQDYGKTGLALYGPLRDLNSVRSNYGIVSLQSYPLYCSLVSPSFLDRIPEEESNSLLVDGEETF